MGEKRRFLPGSMTACSGLLVVCWLVSSAGANVAADRNDADTETLGLYGPDDSVFILDINNFKSLVLESPSAWLVEFYNSWCGHCYRFAPIWKEFAKSLYGWRDIVTVAAIDCADENNYPLCREYEIMGYPAVKYFHMKSKSDHLGISVKPYYDDQLLKASLINLLIKDEEEQRAGPTWPNIVPYRNSEIKTLWEGVPDNIEYQFLIVEEPDSKLGAMIILDLYKLKNIRIRRLNSNNLVLTSAFNVKKFPSVVIYKRDSPTEILKINTMTREEIVKAIKTFMESKGLSTDFGEYVMDKYHSPRTFKTITEEAVESSIVGDKLYQLDLEAALRYSLSHEISLSSNISDEKMTALKLYLKVLHKYFPAYLPETKTYLQILQEIVETKQTMTGKEFKEQVNLIEKGLHRVYSAPKTWIGCKGSSPTFRGYPCTLWTLFHTLTVAAAENNDEGATEKNLPSILVAMHGYIKNFFGCSDCANHFQDMAAKRNLFDARNRDDDIIWLWEAHNEVNERLAGDETEDPRHPKIQYPSAKDCPQCRSPNGQWNKQEVLSYLKTKYSKSSIDLQGVIEKVHDVSAHTASSGANFRKFGWDFTVFDFSICVVLYVVSATILILVCIKFVYRRTSKSKTKSIHHLFGFA